MKIGCQMAFNESTSPTYIKEVAQYVEEQGFHQFWAPEHVLFFPEYDSKYPYTEDGKITGELKSLLDPFSALTFVAAHTSTIRLGTGICIVPQRNPVYTAKMVADLDYLSGGRFELGVGIGWLKEEFEALGVPWKDRAGRTRECVEVMHTLWCDEVSSYEGKYYQIKAAYQNPKPIQQPHPPVIFGGESDPALQRVADLGQGWFGYNFTVDRLEERLEYLSTCLEEKGRTLADMKLYISLDPSVRERSEIDRIEKLGIEQIVVLMGGNMEQIQRQTQKAMDRILG